MHPLVAAACQRFAYSSLLMDRAVSGEGAFLLLLCPEGEWLISCGMKGQLLQLCKSCSKHLASWLSSILPLLLNLEPIAFKLQRPDLDKSYLNCVTRQNPCKPPSP
jgi:hypothetical protein